MSDVELEIAGAWLREVRRDEWAGLEYGAENTTSGYTSSADLGSADGLVEQLRRLVHAATAAERQSVVDRCLPADAKRLELSVKRRRVVAVCIAGVLAVVLLAAGFAIANKGRSAAPNNARSVSTDASLSPAIPATPYFAAVVSVGRTRVPSSVFKIDPSSNASAFDVIHYEVWRRDASVKGAPWQVVANIQANLMSNGHIYTDVHERLGHKYSFRVVAVSATRRSEYHEIAIVAA